MDVIDVKPTNQLVEDTKPKIVDLDFSVMQQKVTVAGDNVGQPYGLLLVILQP